jgi:uncharacterized protein YcbX
MIGEEIEASEVTARGLVGDREYALIDPSTSKVVSAKNPAKWARMFEFHAAYLQPPRRNAVGPVGIVLPDGTTVRTDDEKVDGILSGILGRDVRLASPGPAQPRLEEYWPDMEGLAHRETVTDEAMPEGTFFDLAAVHILTTATLGRLRELYPEGRFEPRRFRPNILVDTGSGDADFAEDAWVGRTVAVGDEVRFAITGPCPRCVMTTLPQEGLPRDPGILRTAAEHNQVNVGVYGDVVRGGTIRRGDPVRLEP